jgi:hypothetical protein
VNHCPGDMENGETRDPRDQEQYEQNGPDTHNRSPRTSRVQSTYNEGSQSGLYQPLRNPGSLMLERPKGLIGQKSGFYW